MVVSNLTRAGQSQVALLVTYRSDVGIDESSLFDSNLTVTGPDGQERSVTQGNVTHNGDGSITVEYDVQKDDAGHNFNATDNGNYTVDLGDDEVVDNQGVSVAGKRLGTFRVDIPMPPGGIQPPTATLHAPTLTTPATVEQIVSVTYKGNAPIDDSSFDDQDLVLSGQDASHLAVTYLTSTSNSDGSVTAQYSIQKDSHAQFTQADNGEYTVSIAEGEVSDNEGTLVLPGAIGHLIVNVPAAPEGALPTAVAQASDLTGNQTQETIHVLFRGDAPIARQTLDDNDLIVKGPDGQVRTAVFASASPNPDGSISANYTVSFGGFYPIGPVRGPIPLGGGVVATAAGTAAPRRVATSNVIRWPIPFPRHLQGTCDISLQPGQVSDSQGRTAAAANIGSFQVDINLPNYWPILEGGAASDGNVVSINGSSGKIITQPLPKIARPHPPKTAPHVKKSFNKEVSHTALNVRDDPCRPIPPAPCTIVARVPRAPARVPRLP